MLWAEPKRFLTPCRLRVSDTDWLRGKVSCVDSKSGKSAKEEEEGQGGMSEGGGDFTDS